MSNREIAEVLERVADLLEVQGANAYRVRAYRNAARTIEFHGAPVAAMVERGEDLTTLPGVGRDLAAKVGEVVRTGSLALCRELEAEVGVGVLELLRLPGLGPAKARRLAAALGVDGLEALERACRDGRVAALPGFGARSQEKLLAALAARAPAGPARRLRLDEADRVLAPLLEHLGRAPGVSALAPAGSYRRRLETVGDLDVVAASDAPAGVIAHLLAWPAVARVEGAGDTRATVVLRSGLSIDLRVVAPASFGAALVYLTGSKAHNIRLRQRAIERGCRLSEYGLDRLGPGGEAGERLAGASEEDVYAALGLALVPPELREDRGEVEAAASGRLPRLLELAELRGDFQMHSTWSDGRASLQTMVAECEARGYEYAAITDHSPALPMIRGLTPERLVEQWREIDEVAARHPGIRILRALEVDVLADGVLDCPDELLARLDLAVAAVHTRFNLSAAEQTARVLRAVRHPAVRVLAHPLGRKIGEREPMAIDLPAVLAACAEHGVAVELNAAPDRLDLPDAALLRAWERGLVVAISSDAHSPGGLGLIRYGVEQARRAWLGPEHVLNAWSLERLEGWLLRG